MEARVDSQQEHNGSFRLDSMVSPLAEALWRLRLSPSAHDLHVALPASSFISPVLVDLSVLLAPEVTFELDDIHATLMLPPASPEVLGRFDTGH